MWVSGQICRILDIKECDHKGKHLGLPFCKFHSKNEAIRGVEEELANTFMGCKSKILSVVSLVTLIKSVAQTIPGYVMQTFCLPKAMLLRMDRHKRQFFWGFKDYQTIGSI